jgi:hypothetical protein
VSLRQYFFGVGFAGFCRGFCKKRLFRRGFLMVSLWLSAGESWSVDGQFPGLKNMPQILDLFFGDCHLGITRRGA